MKFTKLLLATSIATSTGMPYEGIDNLRPETKKAVDAFLLKQNVHLR